MDARFFFAPRDPFSQQIPSSFFSCYCLYIDSVFGVYAVKRAFSSFICLLLCLVLLLSIPLDLTVQAGTTALTGTVSSNAEVLLFENYGGTALFAYTDTNTHVLSADGTRACTTTYPGDYAFLCGSTVRVVCDLNGFMGVQCFSADTFTETDFYGVQISRDDIHFLEADRFGRLYAVLNSDPTAVAVFDAAGSSIGRLSYGESVQGIQVLGSTLYVFLRSRCDCVSLGSSLPQTTGNTFSYSASACPFRMLDQNAYITLEGCICSISGTVLTDTNQSIRNKKLVSAGSGMLYWASSGSVISRFDSGSSARATLQLSGTAAAISDTAAIVRKNNAFCYEPYGTFIAAATPTPVPTASPAPSASPSPSGTTPPDTPSITLTGSYLFAPADTTAARLRAAFPENEIQIYTTTMQTASGKLRTGWIAMIDGTLYTIIVPGDINGSGTVNTADLRLLQAFLAGDNTPTDAERLAADLSGSGSVDAADLVLLVACIAH